MENEEKLYFGQCRYCNIELSKEDARFVYHIIKDYKNYDQLILVNLEILLKGPKLLSKVLSEMDINLLNKYYLLNEDNALRIANQMISNLIEDVLLEEIYDYCEKKVDYNEKYVMKFFNEEIENLDIEDKLETLSDAHFKTLFPIIDNFNTLSKGLFYKLKHDYIGQDDLDCMFDYPGTSKDEFRRDCNITLYYDLWSDRFIKEFTREGKTVIPR